MKSKYEKGLFIILLIFLLLGGAIGYSYWQIDQANKEKIAIEENYVLRSKNALALLDIEAKSFAVYDFTINRELYSHNADIVLPLASLTKIISIPLALKANSYDTLITEESIKMPGDDKLVVGDVWDSRELAKFALVISSNDATEALTARIPGIVTMMNERAKRFGAKETIFLNTTGLDIEDRPGAFGTAREMNILSYAALVNDRELFEATTQRFFDTNSRTLDYLVENTNIVVDQLLGTVLFSKTGYTDLAGGNLSIIWKNKEGHDIGITVLGSGYESRFTDMAKIVEALYDIPYASH
ncbi:MAG: D-alanyl-D-alanine carboxypeptidase family protein [Candidatus Paceibacteria bacterium]